MRRYATSSYMRKWMSERLKRRKKAGDGPTKGPSNAPEPLQPKYYDNEPAARPQSPAEAPAVQSRHPSRPEPQSAPTPEPASAPVAASAAVEPRPRTPRRRRSRGGRGGSRPRPVAAAPVPAVAAEPSAVAASAPEPVVAAPSPAPARASKGAGVLAIWLPGSGQSSWFKRH